MDYSRRRFVGATVVTAAGLTLASCVSSSRKWVAPAISPPVLAPPPAVVASGWPLLDEARTALDAHAGHFVHRDRIALADFSRPSSEARFHIVDLASGRIERSYLVAHGSGSDPDRTGMLQRFSNQPGSNASSRGAYLTAGTYVGKHGRSRKLIGLDPDNSMALDRAIVVHGAAYVDPAMVASQGRIGRSQGCFAFEQGKVAEVMELLGEGRMIYAAKPGAA
jgi:hypothetical protein